jgi:hypothetical protein
MYKVIETPSFERAWPDYWTELDRIAFSDFIAHPFAGVVVAQTGGVRKIRWRRPGIGKSGGVCVIYFVRTTLGQIYLLKIYSKADMSTVSAAVLRRIRYAIES